MTPTPSDSPSFPVYIELPSGFLVAHLVPDHLKRIVEHAKEHRRKQSAATHIVSSNMGSLGEALSVDDVELYQALLKDTLYEARIVISLTGIIAFASNPPQVDAKASATEEANFEGATVTHEALGFCVSGGILGDLKRGIELAREHFSADSRIRVYLETDPEDADEYAVIEVISSRDPAIDSESYFRYLEEWSLSTKWPASRMILLDLKRTDERDSQ